MSTSPAPQQDEQAVSSPNLDEAYAICREIARREAKNFYYAFVALPTARRNAICAVYAFMRKADDLSDDESLPREERRLQLDSWLAAWHQAREGGAREGAATCDPVFVAVRDAAARFQIPFSLLDELVAGTTMDLEAPVSDKPDTYDTFADLYRYCYLVASVVGLVCIRIFGYSDPRAEKLAEETGIAFQLTNILRDVREDAERNRIYIPLEDLAEYRIDVSQLINRSGGITYAERVLFEHIALRAEGYYKSARQLLPLIDAESRPALWVLVSIYHGLLKRIEKENYDVFAKRISVPTVQKLGILSAGIVRMGALRLFGPLFSK
jgi:phytoene synthase